MYLINIVDEVTQYEFVGAVAAISERFPVPVLDGLLGLFPFAVVGFHADNGSEYINHTVAALLKKLHVRDHLSPYLNHHRPCLFATERVGANGRVRCVYRAVDVPTPYDKLRSLPNAEECLRPGISFAELDAQAHALSDQQAARALNAGRERLFRSIADTRLHVA